MESNNSSFPFYDGLIAGGVIFVSSTSGLIVYILFLTVVFQTREYYENSYHVFAAALGILDCISLLVLAFYSAPCMFTGIDLGGPTLNILMGAVIVINWYGSLPIICYLAFNRFYCICRRELYKTVFSIRNTKIMIIVSYVFGLLYGIPPLCDCCHQIFYPLDYYWAWDVSQYGGFVINWLELALTTLTVLISGVCNAIVFMTYHKLHQDISENINGAQHEQIRRERELKLCVQFVLLALWITLFDIVYVIGPYVNQSKWFFLFTTWMYTMNTCLNGWLYMIINGSIRRRVWEIFRGNTKVESLPASHKPAQHGTNLRRASDMCHIIVSKSTRASVV